MKKISILFLCIILATFTLSAYAQEDTLKTMSESNINSSAESISTRKDNVSTDKGSALSNYLYNDTNNCSDNSLPVVDMSSDMSATPYVPLPNNLKNNPELELKLRQDYFTSYEKIWGTKYDEYGKEIKLENLCVVYYFGTVNNCEIAFMPHYSVVLASLVESINVADHTIILYNTHVPLLLHCGSEFYKLEDAYEKGIISKDNVCEIGKLVKEHGWGEIS